MPPAGSAAVLRDQRHPHRIDIRDRCARLSMATMRTDPAVISLTGAVVGSGRVAREASSIAQHCCIGTTFIPHRLVSGYRGLRIRPDVRVAPCHVVMIDRRWCNGHSGGNGSPSPANGYCPSSRTSWKPLTGSSSAHHGSSSWTSKLEKCPTTRVTRISPC